MSDGGAGMTDKDDDAQKQEPAQEVQADQHVKTFFLALAAQGKEAWNAWRRDPANADIHVNFAGVDFSDSPLDEIDFSGFEFGDGADFSGCKWRGVNWDEVHALDAFHPGRASFGGATFGDLARFDGATFGGGASFTGATFGGGADFKNVVFKGRTVFAGKSIVQWSKDFDRRSDHDNDEKEKTARAILKKRHEDSWAINRSGPDRFLGISFSGASFHGAAIFSDRSFEQVADFTNTSFYRPPDFDGATNVQRIDFTGAKITFVRPGHPHWTSQSSVAIRLRALRRLAEDTKNHDLERDLYIEERKAERGAKWSRLWPQTRSAAGRLAKASLVILRPHHIARPAMLNWSDPARVVLRRIWAERARRFLSAAGQLASYSFWIIVMAAYWALADYGRSFLRPLFWLIASWAFFRWRYEDVFAPILQKLRAMGDLQAGQIPQYHDTIHMLALGHAVPFVGAFTVDSDIKKFLLCGNAKHCTLIPPPCYQGLVITQNLISILLVFFAGLALRNYFKIK